MHRAESHYDCIVIGGGVTGSGAARDLAMRGLRVALIEKRDFGGGTTGASSGMIHGGLRYLTYDVRTTRLSCQDSGYIQKIAPHCIFRIPFLFPVLEGGPVNRIFMELVESLFKAYDRYQPLKGGREHVRLSRDEALRIEPGLTPGIIGAVSMDEWGIDTFRLACMNAVSAAGHGAEVFNHATVTGLLRSGAAVTGVKVKIAGDARELRGRVVLNAAGPWAMAVAGLAGLKVALRPAKGVHLIFDRRLVNCAVIITAIDGRSLFLQPHGDVSLLGTTDDDYYGDLDDVPVTGDEVEYLLQAAERVYPSIRRARIIRAMAGVRPTLFQWGPNEDKLYREHAIHDHEQESGIAGFVTIAGGKLASYRVMAEEVSDLVCRKLGVSAGCRTHLEPLPGGEERLDPEELAAEYGVPRYITRALVFRHGAGAREIAASLGTGSTGRNVICACEGIIEAELRYSIRHEWARSLDDLRRRTRLGMGACQGAGCAFKAAMVLGEELHLSPSSVRAEWDAFLQARWKGKRPILMYGQLAQESMARWLRPPVVGVRPEGSCS
ncbi:FAD-dependent oxidoreductase [bacterium]|nr:FAD-dependent oxidoreductase [candidate division CSSED10-310 bacterium]